jgi:hypothetical protein
VICEAGAERAGPACGTGEVAVLTGVDNDEKIGAGVPAVGEKGDGAFGTTGYKDEMIRGAMSGQYHGKALTTRRVLKLKEGELATQQTSLLWPRRATHSFIEQVSNTRTIGSCDVLASRLPCVCEGLYRILVPMAKGYRVNVFVICY